MHPSIVVNQSNYSYSLFFHKLYKKKKREYWIGLMTSGGGWSLIRERKVKANKNKEIKTIHNCHRIIHRPSK